MSGLNASAGRIAFLCAMVLLMFSFANAESVQWNISGLPTLYQMPTPASGGRCVPMLGGVVGSVQYGANVYDSAGVNVCGATIPKGTSLTLSFSPHISNDIYWVGTGYSWDSPYGDWVAGAAMPSGSLCQDKNFYYNGDGGSRFYASLSVAPPTKSITKTDGLTCGSPGANGSLSCTASAVGTVSPTFSFQPTTAHYYFNADNGAGTACGSGWSPYPFLVKPSADNGSEGGGTGWNSCGPATEGNNPYTISVPAQSIACSIEVIDAEGDPPAPPVVNTSGGLACVVGTPYSITITATDPDDDDVKYGIDWDANGTVDQFAPSSGYVPSGTSQTVSRTYATAGNKTVKVIAIDENGLTSGWTTRIFSCTDSGSEQQGEGEDLGGGDEGGGGGGDSGITPNLTIRAIPSFVQAGETTKLHWSASNVTACTVTGNNDSFEGTISPEPEGQQTSAIQEQTTYTLSCEDEDGNILTQSATVSVNPIWNEPGL